MAVVDIKNLAGKKRRSDGFARLCVWREGESKTCCTKTVRWYQAEMRAGTHKDQGVAAKCRGLRAASFGRQKGNRPGPRPRVGSIRSSILGARAARSMDRQPAQLRLPFCRAR